MVVIGSARAPGEGRPVCSVAWSRQCLHHQQQNTKTGIKMAAQAGETLPVVELKPFTRKVWRREKSLPNFYDKQPKEDPGSETARKAGNDPPPNIVRYIRELSEQRKTVDTRQSVDSTQRYRSKMHPKADFSFEGRVATEHQQDLIPSFITRHERTKTTLLGPQGEDNVTAVPAVATADTVPAGTAAVTPPMTGREVSNLLAAYTRDKPLHQQPVCVKGGKLTGSVGRRPLHYLKPFSAYREKQPWSVCRQENSPIRCTPRNAVSLSLSRGSGGVTSSANGAAGRRDLVLSGSTFRAQEKFPLQPLRMSHVAPHKFNSKLGAARDSLSLLSRHGAPTVVEKNLSYDLELRMERCRRERSFAAIGETNVLSTAHYVAYDSQPTRGEVTLMRAREANKSRDGKTTYRRNGLQKPLGLVHHNNPPVSFMLARAPEHVSPRSRSDQGDSGIQSSAGDAIDDVPRIGEILPNNGVVIPRDLGEEVILEQPGDCDEHYDEDKPDMVWNAEQAMWMPAEMVQHIHDSIQRAERDERLVEGRPSQRDDQPAPDKGADQANIPGGSVPSREINQTKKSVEPAAALSNTQSERPKSDTVLVGGAPGRKERSSEDSEESDKDDVGRGGKEMRDSSTLTDNDSDDSAEADGLSRRVKTKTKLKTVAESPSRSRAENRSRQNVHQSEQASNPSPKLGNDVTDDATVNSESKTNNVDDKSLDSGGENKAFETREHGARAAANLSADDMELESLASKSVSSPVNLDSARGPVKDAPADNRKANEGNDTVKPDDNLIQETPGDGTQKQQTSQGELTEEKSNGQVMEAAEERAAEQLEEAKAADKELIPESEATVFEPEKQDETGAPTERRQSQLSGLPPCSNKQQNDATENSETVSNKEGVITKELPPNTDAEKCDSVADAAENKVSSVPNSERTEDKLEANSDPSAAQPTGLEHDIREDQAVLRNDNEQEVVQEIAPTQDLEKVASVTLAVEQTDGFEGEKTFITTTNIETEEWNNMVEV